MNTPRKGYIHLESEGGVVLYRNLRVKELPSAGTLPPEQVAQADEGFVPLYTGTDFSGWQHPKGHEGHWVSKDWVICTTAGAQRRTRTSGRRNPTATSLRSPTGAGWTTGSMRLLRSIRFAGVELPDEARNTVGRALLPSVPKGEWRRALVTKRRGRLTLVIDGKTVFQEVAVPGLDRPGRIALRHDGRAVEFANVYLKQF